MSAAVTVSHQIGAPLEVVPAAMAEKSAALATAAAALATVDAANVETANRVLVDIHAAAKALEARRVELKKPVTQLGKAIDECVERAAAPLDQAKRSLAGKVAVYQREVQAAAERARREREEAEAKARAAAEEERKRLQAEADARHAAEVAAAKAKAEAEAKELGELLGAPVEAAPVQVAPPPVVAAPAVVLPAAPPPPVVKPAAVTTRKVQVVEITDPRAVAAAYEIAGTPLVEIDRAAVKRLLLAGVAVPGARLVEEEQVAVRGVR